VYPSTSSVEYIVCWLLGPGEAVAQVCALAEETFDLIEKRVPGLDTVPVRLALVSDRTITG